MEVNWSYVQVMAAIHDGEVYPEGSKKALAIFQRSTLNFAVAMRDMRREPNRGFVVQKNLSFELLSSETLAVHGKEVGRASSIGHRDTMEDADLVQNFEFTLEDKVYKGEIYGVFDGHISANVAQFLRQNLVDFFIKGLESCKTLNDEAVWQVFKTVFTQLNEKCPPDGGSTAAVAAILNEKLWVANVGDSRVIVNRNGVPSALTEDADPTSDRYERKLAKLGSFVGWHGYVDDLIGMGRAFGDKMCEGIRATPKICYFPITDLRGAQLVLATDGLFDAGSTKEVLREVETLKGESAEEIAKRLVDSAISTGSKDNISVIVVKL